MKIPDRFYQVDWKWTTIGAVSMSVTMSIIAIIHPEMEVLESAFSGLIFYVFALFFMISSTEDKLTEEDLLEARYIITKQKLGNKNTTGILVFEIVHPDNEMESPGELLFLSVFGEYCPIGSLRGYQLNELITSEKYRVKTIIQKGNIIQL